MDEIKLEIALSEAIGKANAMISLFSALTVTLVSKDVLTREDMATLPGIALQMLDALGDMPVEAREKAESVLKGFSSPWSTAVTRN